MNLDTILLEASVSGEAVARWKNKLVYASTKEGMYKKKYDHNYYIIIDDRRTLVRFENGVCYKYGYVDSEGNVDDLAKPQVYFAIDEVDEVIGNVKIGIMVDKMLKSARDITIDSLLEGFNYGLE